MTRGFLINCEYYDYLQFMHLNKLYNLNEIYVLKFVNTENVGRKHNIQYYHLLLSCAKEALRHVTITEPHKRTPSVRENYMNSLHN